MAFYREFFFENPCFKIFFSSFIGQQQHLLASAGWHRGKQPDEIDPRYAGKL
jgi:hypothetical protein